MLLLRNSLGSASQMSGRDLWCPLHSTGGEKGICSHKTHMIYSMFLQEKYLEGSLQPTKQRWGEWETPQAVHWGAAAVQGEPHSSPQQRVSFAEHGRSGKSQQGSKGRPKPKTYASCQLGVFIQMWEEGPVLLSYRLFPAGGLAVNCCSSSQLQA